MAHSTYTLYGEEKLPGCNDRTDNHLSADRVWARDILLHEALQNSTHHSEKWENNSPQG